MSVLLGQPQAPEKDGGSLRFLYHTAPGRVILKLLSARWLSKVCGAYLDSRMSKWLIKRFVKSYNIDMTQYESEDYGCFNDCFTRRIRSELRPIDQRKSIFISPCDGYLTAFRIKDDTELPVKQSAYSIARLIGSEEQAKRFDGGVCLVFRLCADNYHRYCFVDDCIPGEGRFISGKLHTVRPIALEKYPVFTENCREVTFLETDNFGTVAQVEVGAMLVGKIKNHPISGRVRRGEEKGMFLYGGSTIVMLLEKDIISVDESVFDASRNGMEYFVKQGQPVAEKMR